MTRRELLKRHPYQIFYSSDGRWGTYLPDKDKKRRLVKRKERSDLEDAIIEYYEQTCPSFDDIYCKWRSYHDQLIGDSSILKYDSDAKRYFKDQAFIRMQLNKIRSDDVEVFIRRRIDELHLCQNAAKTLFHYMNCVFEFAVRHDYILKSPMRFMKAKDFYKYTYPSKRSEKPKVISENELEQLNLRYDLDLSKHPDSIPVYAVILSSFTGMRVGEIAALRWDSVFDDYILVDKSQKYNPKIKQYYISKTKNSKIRKFPLTEDIRLLLEQVHEIEDKYRYTTDYIFSDAEGPITFRKISSCIKNKCRQVGIDTFGIHAYRRTVNSKMALNGVPTSIRASLLGHSREVNERYYTFDLSTMDEKLKIMTEVNAQMH